MLARRREREQTQEVAKEEAAFPAPTETAFIAPETRRPLEPRTDFEMHRMMGQ